MDKSLFKKDKSPSLGFHIMLKEGIKRVYFIFPITFAISAPLKSVFISCLVILEPLTHNTAGLNKLKDSFALSQ